MLFNSYIFIFLYLPITIVVFFLIGRRGHHSIAISWLVGASLFYYGWWNPAYLGLILGSILFNYAIGIIISRDVQRQSIYLLAFGIVVNLAFLGFFKYANFFIDNVNSLFSTNIYISQIILPLAISFFTFQQIAYLVDSWNGETREYNFLHYCLFVTFFPQLIAGPIVHHKEMLPQFAKDIVYKLNYENIAVGLSIFILGLLKKVVVADSAARYVTPYFDMAAKGVALTFIDAWTGALAYTFQLYFDFSGYSDMAIGIARIFGILLPINFISPYKAHSIIDFWRRWHVTLSRFLRDYIYFPLGGNRKGSRRRYTNLMITMLLGGLWHGAGWTFVIWGALHGIYLVVNHTWRSLHFRILVFSKYPLWLTNNISWTITFLSVVVAWVFFRAASIDSALYMLETMFGLNGVSFSTSRDISIGKIFAYFGCLMFIVKALPSSMEIMSSYNPVIEKDIVFPKSIITLSWKPTKRWALLYSVFAILSLYTMISKGYHEFIYRFF